jgi:UDP-N-acetyl-2-amino-2-deoxyglucuronate dehydrogenase
LQNKAQLVFQESGSFMRIGIIGTGAISRKNAQAYKSIGFKVTACTDIFEASGRKFAEETGAEFVATVEELCAHPDVDIVDVCTLPNFRMQPLELCAKSKKHILVQKPMATNLAIARAMLDVARKAGIQLGVVSQHRFDDSIQFLRKAITGGRLGRILEADAYVKWHRSAEYFSRPIKGTWEVEGGGALINQAIHQIDMLLVSRGAGLRRSSVTGSWARCTRSNRKTC